MAEITLHRGQKVTLDDEDVERVTSYGRWLCDSRGDVFTNVHKNGLSCVRLNKFVLGMTMPDASILVKHKNGNKFDVRKENLLAHNREWYSSLPDILYACGCGTKIRPSRSCGVTIKFVPGHHGKHRTPEDHSRAIAAWNKRKGTKARQRYMVHKQLCMEYLGNGCYFCGLMYDRTNSPSFEFDHIDSSSKEGEITKIIRYPKVIERVTDELNKCRLACANCHNIRHSGNW